MMAEHKDFFLPDQVDEQIDQLLQSDILSLRDQRLTHTLQTLLQENEDQQSLNRVLIKLQDNRNEGSREDENMLSLSPRHSKRVSSTMSQETISFKRKPHTLPRIFTLLVACLVLVIMVGSLVLVLNAVQQKKSNAGNPTSHSTITVQPSPTPNEPLGKIVYTSGGYDMAFGLQWSPDSQRLAGVLNRTTLTSWDAKTGKHKLMYATPGETLLGYVAWSPDENFLAVESNTKIYVFNAKTTHLIRTLTQPNTTASIAPPSLTGTSATLHSPFLSSMISLSTATSFDKVIWSSDGKYIAASYHDAGTQNAVFVWNAINGSLVKTLNDFPTNIVDISWSPAGTSLVTLAYPNTENSVMPTATIWNTSTWNKIREYPAIEALSWSPDGKQMALVDAEGASGLGKDIRIVNMQNGQTVKQLVAEKNIINVSWSPDGNRIEVELQNNHLEMQILDTISGSRLYTFPQSAYNGTWSPNGKYIACVQSVEEVHILVWVAK
jgi:WD40 repeat protein